MSWTYATSDPTGRQIYRVLEELRAALLERATTFTANYSYMQASLSGRQISAYWLAWFQSIVTDALDGATWINHTDNAGNWEGIAGPAYWTESSMLAAIGAGARLPAPSSGKQISAAWLGQQYDIIDRLRWGSLYIEQAQYVSDHEEWLVNEADKATAEAVYDALGGPTATTSGIGNIKAFLEYGVVPFLPARIFAGLGRFAGTVLSGRHYSLGASDCYLVDATIDCYVRSADDYPAEYDDYGMSNVPAAAGTCLLLESAVSFAAGSHQYVAPSIGGGTFDAYTWPSGSNTDRGWTVYGKTNDYKEANGAIVPVVKFDGVGGFTYLS